VTPSAAPTRARRRRLFRRTAVVSSASLLALLGAALPASAYPGDPDARYGNCGDSISAVQATGDSTAAAFVVASDGSSYLAGRDSGTRVTLTRYAADGSVDRTFGAGGVLTLSAAGGDAASAIALDGSGRLLVGGTSGGTPVLWRVLQGGAVDAAFGAGGRMTAPGTGSVVSLVARADGTAVGVTSAGGLFGTTAAGTADTRLGGTGVLALPSGTTAQRVALVSRSNDDGFAVAVATSDQHVQVLRYSASGAADSAFDSAPPVINTTGALGSTARTEVATGLAAAPDGGIVVGMTSTAAGGTGDLAVARLSPTGGLDTSFGTGGRVVQDFGEAERAASLVVQPDGALLLVGTIGTTDNADVIVSRVTPAGTVDSGFGFGGVLYHDRGGVDSVVGAALGTDGTLLVGGTVRTNRDLFGISRLRLRAENGPTGMTLDATGGLHPFSTDPADLPSCVRGTPSWPGQDIARGVAELPDESGSLIIDLFGGVHFATPYPEMVAPPTITGLPYTGGVDTYRGIAVLPNGRAGLAVDKGGKLWPFSINGGALPTVSSSYASPAGLTRGVVIRPDGTGGYILDGNGGIAAFSLDGNAAPQLPTGNPTWPGFDVARSISLLADGTGGYVTDAFGGVHSFGFPGTTAPALPANSFCFNGADLARGLALTSATGPAPASGGPSATACAVSSTDPIQEKYAAVGGATVLGPATSGEVAVAGGQQQQFAGGTIYWSQSTGAHVVQGAILARYLGMGGPAGPVGFPTTDELGTPDGVGRFNHFTGNGVGASIYWTPGTGAHEVQGLIRARWAALGWEGGPLGYPVTDESTTPDGVGRFNHFSNGGSVYWTPGTGAHAVYGMIRATWAATGWENGPLGYPTTDELGTPDGVGRFNHFSKGGSVYWTPGTGANAVYGAIRAAWAASGWETGPLGYPVTSEFDVPGGRRNVFQRGALTFSWGNGQVSR
jgi:uncharacterized delta-60 repeat protein